MSILKTYLQIFLKFEYVISLPTINRQKKFQKNSLKEKKLLQFLVKIDKKSAKRKTAELS